MFFLFSLVAVISAIAFVVTSHPVHTILALVVVACSVSGVCLTIDAEFLGLLFIVVYVGAIAVLFLFVVMMISVNLLYKNKFSPFTESLSLLALSISIQIAHFTEYKFKETETCWALSHLGESNLMLFNYCLYGGPFSFTLVAAGLLLLVSMIGAIFLTVQDYTTDKTQALPSQLSRDGTAVVHGYHKNKYKKRRCIR